MLGFYYAPLRGSLGLESWGGGRLGSREGAGLEPSYCCLAVGTDVQVIRA